MDHSHYIAVGEFKAKCLSLLEAVRSGRRPLVLTKHGVPIARIVPMQEDDVFEDLKCSVLREDDIVRPVDETWDAEK